jgi:hypothetical protein
MSAFLKARRALTLALGAGLLVLVATLVTGCGGSGGNADLPEPTVEVPAETEQVSVFFATGRSLLEEQRVVDANDRYASTLVQLLAATPETPDVAIVQPEAEIRSVTFEDGVVTIDWDRAILDFTAEPEEVPIAHAAFLVTLGQFPEVEKVRFTVEGKDSGEIDGKDVERFWGEITLADQPWDAVRPPGFEETSGSGETTPSAETETE